MAYNCTRLLLAIFATIVEAVRKANKTNEQKTVK